MDVHQRDGVHGERGVERTAGGERHAKRHTVVARRADLLDCVQRIGGQRERIVYHHGDDASPVVDE